MSVIYNLGSQQFFVFETITAVLIVLSCLSMFFRTRHLYQLSMQKGIYYFSNANLSYVFCFGLAYIAFLIDYFDIFRGLDDMLLVLILSFLTLVTGLIGGLYLSYGLVWRRFEKDSSYKKDYNRFFMMILISAIIAVLDLFFIIYCGASHAYLFYSLMIVMILSSVIVKILEQKKKKGLFSDPLISYVLLAVSIYIALFVESILIDIIPTIHYYVWGLITIFFVALAHNVRRITDFR